MFFYDCDIGRVPDDGQNDVKDGNVENYPLDWENTDPGCPGCCALPEDADPDGMPCEGNGV